MFPSAAQLFSEMRPLESVKALLSVRLSQSRGGERKANPWGCTTSAARISGRAVMWSSQQIKHGSAVQSTTALSSGESEYHALLRSSAHAFVRYSSAATTISARQGLDKTRHVDVTFFFF